MKKNKLPSSSSPERETLRQKGQFWTPEWIADAMTAYVASDDIKEIFDPSVGQGAFLWAAKQWAAKTGQQLRMSGIEIDGEALEQARKSGLSSTDLALVEIGDFIEYCPSKSLNAIIANPPYIRHHRLHQQQKAKLKALAKRVIGHEIDGRAGLHIYFLIHALSLLAPNGRLAFIMPADVCEGVFAPKLWYWISQNFRLDAVVMFAPEATPFPNVDTNPLILLIKRAIPKPKFHLAYCSQANSPQLLNWIESGFEQGEELQITHPTLQDSLLKGITRLSYESSPYVLGDFASVMRGIATGANEFFFLTKAQVKALKIPPEFLRRAIGRTRDVANDSITQKDLNQLDESGRPTYLFAPDGRPLSDFPASVQDYLIQGQQLELPSKALISQRKPWYKMEQRKPPPFLFAYLGRRNTRFIHNLANVLPLTGFLCVYPHDNDPIFIESLWRILSDERVVRNLASVGKSYGSGAIKVEPRALEQLPVPAAVIDEVRLIPQRQLSLF